MLQVPIHHTYITTEAMTTALVQVSAIYIILVNARHCGASLSKRTAFISEIHYQKKGLLLLIKH